MHSGIAVIVVNYNTADLLRACLEHVLASSLDRPLQVYVVDNGSSDGSVAMLQEEFPCVHVIEAGANLGFARANNLALAEILARVPGDADRDHCYVLLLNSDCFVQPDTLQLTARFLDCHPDAGVVGARLRLRDGTLDLACRRAFPTPAGAFWKLAGIARRFPANPRFAQYNLTFLDPDKVSEVDAVSGAYMLVRLSAVDDAGLLDEAFFMYGEDLDWAYRIKQRGWKVYYDPEAEALHYKGSSSSRRSYRMILHFYHAMYVFHRKHYAPDMVPPLRWLIVLGIVLRAGVALAQNALRPAGAKRVA